MMILRIRDWSQHFENNRTRELKKLDWVPLPNGHDGDGYTELLDHDRGPLHYAAWVVMVQVASRCETRGTLMRDGARPYDSASLARRTRIPAEIFDEAIPRLLSIGWLEVVDTQGNVIQGITQISQQGATIPHHVAPISHQGVTEGKGREGKGIEGKGSSCGESQQAATSPPPPDDPVVLTFPCDGEPNSWDLHESHVAKLQRLYPKLDVASECRQCWAWIDAKPERRKTARGMKSAIVNWLNKSTNATNQARAGPPAKQPRDIEHIKRLAEEL